MVKAKKTRATLEELNKELQSHYAFINAKSRRKQNLDANAVCQMQEYIETKMKKANGCILDDSFIKNFRLFKELDEKMFASMTKTLCKSLCCQPIRYDFLKRLTTEWLEYANRFSIDTKGRFFMEHFHLFQMIAKFLPIIGCFSLQQQILKIIFSHVTSPQNAVEGLFKPLIDNSIFDSLKMYEKMSKIQKHVLIYRDIPNSLNRKGKMVYSKGLRYLHFDNKPVDPYPSHDGFCDWNKGTRTIEFSISLYGHEAKTMINSDNMESLHYKVCARTNQVREITFKLNTSLSLYCESKPSLSDDRNVKQIKMTFDSFEADDVEKLVLYMFNHKLVMTKTNENVDMMKPTFNVVENSAGGVFISTPPSSPPKRFQDRMKNVTEFFEITEYSYKHDMCHERPELKHSDSEEEVKAKPAVGNLQVAKKQSAQQKPKAKKRSAQKQSAYVTGNISTGKKNKRNLENVVELKTEGVFVTAIGSANTARKIKASEKAKPVETPTDVIDLDLKENLCIETNNVTVDKDNAPKNKVIVVEEYEPKKSRIRKLSVETRSMKKADQNIVIDITGPPTQVTKRNSKRKSMPEKTNKDDDTLPDSTTKRQNGKRRKSNTSAKPIADSDEESTNMPAEPVNHERQFDSLFCGPFSFKGQVQPNALTLHQKMVSTHNKQNHNTSDSGTSSDSE